jgi:hypothetical protein
MHISSVGCAGCDNVVSKRLLRHCSCQREGSGCCRVTQQVCRFCTRAPVVDQEHLADQQGGHDADLMPQSYLMQPSSGLPSRLRSKEGQGASSARDPPALHGAAGAICKMQLPSANQLTFPGEPGSQGCNPTSSSLLLVGKSAMMFPRTPAFAVLEGALAAADLLAFSPPPLLVAAMLTMPLLQAAATAAGQICTAGAWQPRTSE